jgi:hypothetical protein
VSAIPTKLKVFRRPTQRADIFGVMSAHKPPAENDLRNEIREVLDKITDNETLLFCLWVFKKIARHEEVPPPEKIKALQDAFIRMLNAMRDKKTIRQQDLTLILQYTDTSGLDIARPLAATARYLREKEHLTRREVSRISGFPVRWLIALERGQIQDLSLPEFARLSKGLGLDTVKLMKELEKRLNDSGSLSGGRFWQFVARDTSVS